MEKAGNLWYLKGDMHIHTHYSDGGRLEEVIARVVNCGFDFCAISDHDTFAGSRAALETVESCRSNTPIIIRSQESTCAGCHILSYGTLNKYDRALPLEEVCRSIRAAGGYAVAAHPDWQPTRKNFRESGVFAALVENGLLDGVELMNFPEPSSEADIADEWTNRYYFERSAAGEPFCVTCGSDAHTSADITPERFLAVFAETLDEKGILDAIFRYRRSAAVWGNCVIGTPEACELYRSVCGKRHRDEEITVQREICSDGIKFKVSGAEKTFFYGDIKQLADDTFFKPGFDHGNALLISKKGQAAQAEYIGIADRVEVKCIPVMENGTIRAHFSTSCCDELVFKCRVNGKEFVFDRSPYICGTLLEEQNDISIEVFNRDGVIVGKKHWDFPVCVPDKWYWLSKLTADLPAPDGIEPSAKFKFSRQNDDIILDMEVTDHLFCQPYGGTGMYMGDSVQFGFDFECAASENDLVERKVWEFGICVTDRNTGDFVVYNTPSAAAPGVPAKLKHSAQRKNDTTSYRVVADKNFSGAGAVFGFNMIFNINDGNGRRGYLAWRNGIGDRKKSADWGFVVVKG